MQRYDFTFLKGLLVTPGLLDIHMHADATRREHESGPWRGSLVADTHVFARQFPVIDAEGRVYPYMREARARGVWFDVGHGAASFWFRNAKRAIDDGFPPDSISTDLHAGSIRTTVRSQLDAMSKCLAMGMPLAEVIHRSTDAPAQAIRRPELGTLSAGAEAD